MLRLFDVEQPGAAPQTLPQASAGIRSALFLGGDNTILTSFADAKGIG